MVTFIGSLAAKYPDFGETQLENTLLIKSFSRPDDERRPSRFGQIILVLPHNAPKDAADGIRREEHMHLRRRDAVSVTS